MSQIAQKVAIEATPNFRAPTADKGSPIRPIWQLRCSELFTHVVIRELQVFSLESHLLLFFHFTVTGNVFSAVVEADSKFLPGGPSPLCVIADATLID